MIRNRERVAVIAPTAVLARAAAAFLDGRLPHFLSPFSLPDYLATPRAPQRIVLCPSGRSVASDIDFLRRAQERVLWGAPEDVVYSAIEGLLGSLPPTPPAGARRRRVAVSGERSETAAALLLEGTVTSARARALLPEDPRLWIVEHPRRVRLDAGLMETLRRKGVRWAALEPVLLLGLLVSPRLAAARSRWGRLLPRATRIWIRPGLRVRRNPGSPAKS